MSVFLFVFYAMAAQKRLFIKILHDKYICGCLLFTIVMLYLIYCVI